MINLIPMLILSTVTHWNTLYNYESTCKVITENTIYVNGECAITCEFVFEGTMQFNNKDSFAFNPNVKKEINFYGYDFDSAEQSKTLLCTGQIPVDYRGFDITSNTIREFEFVDRITLQADMYGIEVRFTDSVFQTYFMDAEWCDDNLFNDNEIQVVSYVIDGTSEDLRSAWGRIFDFRLLTLIDDNNAIYNLGYNQGLQDVDREQFDYGYQSGRSDGYQLGYNTGYNEALEADTMAVTIFNGILSIAMIPVDFFLSIFNFEILGVNLTSFVTALLSVGCLIILLKKIFGSGGGDDK